MNHPFIKSLEGIEVKLDDLKRIVESTNKSVLSKEIINNEEFIKIFNISPNTALNWREQGLISYSQINSKIYYRVDDVKGLIDENYKPIKKKH
jgi:hypothetical protein